MTMPNASPEYLPGQLVRLMRDCGELRAGETLIVFHDGARQWASRDGTEKTPKCSGEHVPDKPSDFGPTWEPITEPTPGA
jgi:hypothetical protein